jgi:WD40 repeat protein
MTARRAPQIVLALLAFAAPDARPAGPPALRPADLYGDPLPPGALARLGTVRFRHGNSIKGVAVSPDGKRLASTGADGIIRLWDFATGRPRRTFWGRFDSLLFSPDGKVLAGGITPDGPVAWWEVATRKELGCIPGRFTCHAFTADGKRLAAGAAEGPVRLWEVRTAREVRAPAGYPRGALALAFSPDGKRGAAATRDALALLDARTGKVIRRIPVVGSCLAFSPDGKTLAFGTTHEPGKVESPVLLYDAATGKERRRLEGPRLEAHRGGVTCLGFSADGTVLLSADHEGTACVWRTATGEQLCRVFAAEWQGVGFALAPDGKTLVSGGHLNTVRLWDAATGKLVPRTGGHAGEVIALAFTPGGKSLLTTGVDQTVRSWDPATGKERRRLDADGVFPFQVAFSPGGDLLAGLVPNDSLGLLDLGRGRVVREFGKDGVGSTLAFSPDGKALAADGLAADGPDGSIRRWEVARGKQVRKLTAGDEGRPAPRPWRCLAFSPNGERLAAGRGNAHDPQDSREGSRDVCVWDVRSGKELLRLSLPEDDYLYGTVALAFTPDGRALVSGGTVIRAWDAATGKELRRFGGGLPHPGNPGIRCMAVSPDGRLAASAGWDGGTIRLWELATGGEVRTLEGHAGSVTCLSFSPAARRLASAGCDTTALVWDVTGVSGHGKGRPSAAELRAAWEDLAGRNAARAYRGVALLAASPAQAVPFLRARLRPVPRGEGRRIARLVADLDSEEFGVREQAARELAALREAAEPTLRRTLGGKPPLEQRRRIERLLARLSDRTLTPGELRRGRALAALEYSAAPAARRFLAELAGGAPEAPLTQEARSALARLGKP